MKFDEEAVGRFHPAVEHGLAPTQFNLGLMYYKGQGVEQDHAKAVKCYRLAAEEGNVKAQHNLGVAYHNGRGVAQNYKEAYIWHSIAAGNGLERSVKYRNDDAKLLSASDLAEAQAEALRRMEKIRKKQAKSEGE